MGQKDLAPSLIQSRRLLCLIKELYGFFVKEVGSYCQPCKITGHHTRECPIPTRPLPTLPNNYKSMFNDNHFLLMKHNNGKVAVKFIGVKPKVNPPSSLWILKENIQTSWTQ
jgi:hypothetical protein